MKELPLKIKNLWVATDARKVTIMTHREFLNTIISGTINDEIIAQATKELAQLDAGLEKKRNTLTPKQEANLALCDVVYEKLNTETPTTATMLYEMGIEGITSIPKASSILRMLLKMERVSVEDVVVTGKGRVQKGYKRV